MQQMYIRAVMPEGKKHWGCQKVIGGDNLPSPVGIGLTVLPNFGPVAPLPRFRHQSTCAATTQWPTVQGGSEGCM